MMRASDFERCFMIMPRLAAEDHLMQMAIAQYPHSKDEFRKSLHREVYLLANPRDESEKALSTADLAKILAMGGGA